MPAVLASPYLFARKVDVDIDPSVFHIWDQWMGAKLAAGASEPSHSPFRTAWDGGSGSGGSGGSGSGGSGGGGSGALSFQMQAPIGHSPGDPLLSIRFRAPGLAADESRRRRRRVAKIEFEDGSACGCGDACDAIDGGCCEATLCGGGGSGREGAGSRSSASANATVHNEGADDGVADAPCPVPSTSAASRAGGDPLVVSWVNRCRFPIAIVVLDYGGIELPMRARLRPAESAAFNSHERLIWRARALNGELLGEYEPTLAAAAAAELLVVEECRFRHRGAAALLARSPVTAAAH